MRAQLSGDWALKMWEPEEVARALTLKRFLILPWHLSAAQIDEACVLLEVERIDLA